MKTFLYIGLFLLCFVHFQATAWSPISRRDFDRFHGKFGLPKAHLYQFGPIYYDEKPARNNPLCLPIIWTCGPGLPPCCPGLFCYAGNAKRGRHCVSRRWTFRL